ncbi:phosphorylase family protein [Thiohalorhabdus denitrificans]|uniref:Adenosylhomocysteine nucleosidase n=1 Tax=Thiohalorhabdus denitrificans TaxID=381306 RepID=A0A1G5AVY1_9GAMM|nr:hypothetical protein [Thiohalorhabdus denitrificans]SCX81980.1 adenosylhomocysteine nucleosidase [Thiohalorhabdus denitrificans]
MTVGVVAALPLEAACLPAHPAEAKRPAARVEVSGPGPQRGEAAARRLATEEVEALMSWGVAGGLDPALPAGTLILPERLHAPAEPPVDAAWRSRLQGALAPRLPVSPGPLLHAGEVAAPPALKADLYRATGATAVDQESGPVARVAREAGLPFVAVRVVADPAGRGLPRVAQAALRPDGTLHGAGLLRALLREPAALPGLAALGLDLRRARATLREAGRIAGPRLGAGDGTEVPAGEANVPPARVPADA